MITAKRHNYVTKTDEVKTFGVGTTLYRTMESVQVMSDIWDYLPVAYYEDNGKINRMFIEPEDVITIDADMDAVSARVFAHEKEKAANEIRRAAEIEAERVDVKDRVIKVVAGRNSKGSVGKVVFVKEMMYAMGYRSRSEPKLCVALDDTMVEVRAANGKIYNNYANVIWVWARNCEVKVPCVNLVGLDTVSSERAQSVVNVLKRDVEKFNFVKEAA